LGEVVEVLAVVAGIRTLIFPADNRKDFDDLPQHVRQGLSPHFVATFDEVLAVAFAKR